MTGPTSEPEPGGDRIAEVVAAALAELGVPVSRHDGDAFLLTLPGERRHRPWSGSRRHHDLLIESFVCRQPDDNHQEVYRFLLQRNARLRAVAYALDQVGDIHLVGRIGRDSVTAAEIDRVLGTVLDTADSDFNAILERGFADAIRREWAWRTSRGESVRNLEAFRHLI